MKHLVYGRSKYTYEFHIATETQQHQNDTKDKTEVHFAPFTSPSFLRRWETLKVEIKIYFPYSFFAC